MIRWLLALSAGLAFAALGTAEREWNFDCLAYAALAHSSQEHDAAHLHALVYSELRAVAPQRAVGALTTDSDYRAALVRDPGSFAKLLPFYSNKPLYVGLVALVARFNVNAIAASFAVSAVAYGLLAMVVLASPIAPVSTGLWWAVSLCLLLAPPLREVASLATPDALAALLSFAGARALLSTKRVTLGMVLLVSSIAARLDAVLFALALLGWLGWTKPEHRTAAIYAIAASLCACVTVAWMSNGYSWAVLIEHSFVRRLLDPALASNTTMELGPSRYLHIVARGLRGDYVLHPSVVWLFAIFSLCARSMATSTERSELHVSRARLHGLLWLAIGLHFLAFPMLADRFFVAHYLCAVLLAVASLRQHAEPSQSAR